MCCSNISWLFLPEVQGCVALDGLASLECSDAIDEGVLLVWVIIKEVTGFEKRVIVIVLTATRSAIALIVAERR